MNWVGGARNRIRVKNEKRQQKEYFARKKFVKKVARTPPSLSDPPGHRTGEISQDMLLINALARAHDPRKRNRSMKPTPKVTHVDFAQFETPGSGVGSVGTPHHLPMSPITQPSMIRLSDAADEKENYISSSSRKIPSHRDVASDLLKTSRHNPATGSSGGFITRAPKLPPRDAHHEVRDSTPGLVGWQLPDADTPSSDWMSKTSRDLNSLRNTTWNVPVGSWAGPPLTKKPHSSTPFPNSNHFHSTLPPPPVGEGASPIIYMEEEHGDPSSLTRGVVSTPWMSVSHKVPSTSDIYSTERFADVYDIDGRGRGRVTHSSWGARTPLLFKPNEGRRGCLVLGEGSGGGVRGVTQTPADIGQTIDKESFNCYNKMMDFFQDSKHFKGGKHGEKKCSEIMISRDREMGSEALKEVEEMDGDFDSESVYNTLSAESLPDTQELFEETEVAMVDGIIKDHVVPDGSNPNKPGAEPSPTPRLETTPSPTPRLQTHLTPRDTQSVRYRVMLGELGSGGGGHFIEINKVLRKLSDEKIFGIGSEKPTVTMAPAPIQDPPSPPAPAPVPVQAPDPVLTPDPATDVPLDKATPLPTTPLPDQPSTPSTRDIECQTDVVEPPPVGDNPGPGTGCCHSNRDNSTQTSEPLPHPRVEQGDLTRLQHELSVLRHNLNVIRAHVRYLHRD